MDCIKDRWPYLSDLSVLGYVMLHSRTVGEALVAYQKYNVISCSGFSMNHEEQGDDLVICLYASNPSTLPSLHWELPLMQLG
ncbi:hypothetical protein D3C87_1890660 [compost metagenome]